MSGKFTGELKAVGKQILGRFLLGPDDYWTTTVAEMDEMVEGWEEIAEMMVRGSKRKE